MENDAGLVRRGHAIRDEGSLRPKRQWTRDGGHDRDEYSNDEQL